MTDFAAASRPKDTVAVGPDVWEQGGDKPDRAMIRLRPYARNNRDSFGKTLPWWEKTLELIDAEYGDGEPGSGDAAFMAKLRELLASGHKFEENAKTKGKTAVR